MKTLLFATAALVALAGSCGVRSAQADPITLNLGSLGPPAYDFTGDGAGDLTITSAGFTMAAAFDGDTGTAIFGALAGAMTGPAVGGVFNVVSGGAQSLSGLKIGSFFNSFNLAELAVWHDSSLLNLDSRSIMRRTSSVSHLAHSRAVSINGYFCRCNWRGFQSIERSVSKNTRFVLQCDSEGKMRTALYARVSKKDGRQDTENQLRQLRQFASTQRWTISAEYVDRATGKRSDREQFQKMFEAASRREFDILLFWSLDRLSREGTVETLNHLQRLTGYGVNYRSFTEQYLDSTGIFKEAVIGILAAVAKQERVRLSERTIAGLERARAQGRVGGRPKTEDDHRKVKALLQLRKQGRSVRQIAAELRLSTNTVLKVLRRAA